jgi:hypothetical protein
VGLTVSIQWGQTEDNRDGTLRKKRPTVGFTEAGVLENGLGTGHGGTATGRFVSLVAEKLKSAKDKTGVDPSEKPRGIGVGLFAHGWAYEHFMPGTSMDRFMWEGEPNMTPLISPTDSRRMKVEEWQAKQEYRKTHDKEESWGAEYDCPCKTSIAQHLWEKPANNDKKWPVDFKDWPITKSAQRYPVGTDSFFHTDYTEPVIDMPGHMYQYRLGQQSVLPIPGARHPKLEFTDAGNTMGHLQAVMSTKCTLRVKLQNQSIKDTSTVKGFLELHYLNIDGSLKPEVVLAYQRLKDTTGLTIRLCVTAVDQAEKDYDQFWDLSGPASQTGHFEIITQPIRLKDPKDHIKTLGIALDGPAKPLVNLGDQGVADLVDVVSLTVKPQGYDYPEGKIAGAALERKATPYGSYLRLVWNLVDGPKAHDSLPWSPTTKQFSHFQIWANKEYLGVANALGFPISEAKSNGWPKGNVHVQIRGVTFDGRRKDSGGWENDIGVPA